MNATPQTTPPPQTKLTPAQLRILREVANGSRNLRRNRGSTFDALLEAGLLRREFIGAPMEITEAGFDALSKAGAK